MNVLSVPPAATRDERSVEMLRVWIAEQGLHCSLRIGMYAADGPQQETTAWGIILADAIHHIADGLQAEGLGRGPELVEAIVTSLRNEIEAPSSKRTGGFSSGAQ